MKACAQLEIMIITCKGVVIKNLQGTRIKRNAQHASMNAQCAKMNVQCTKMNAWCARVNTQRAMWGAARINVHL